jgi:hypothetical protein
MMAKDGETNCRGLNNKLLLDTTYCFYYDKLSSLHYSIAQYIDKSWLTGHLSITVLFGDCSDSMFHHLSPVIDTGKKNGNKTVSAVNKNENYYGFNVINLFF